jgi:hypothetical protein
MNNLHGVEVREAVEYLPIRDQSKLKPSTRLIYPDFERRRGYGTGEDEDVPGKRIDNTCRGL